MAADPLARYNAKRDFARTAEPKGRRGKAAETHHFLVQKHDATRLHWDFRLELDGVLKSWAVTRGPSLDPADKRLAVRTEDHPLDYATFEGTIPEGEYGGGTVMLWDRGTWTPVPGKDPRKTLEEGHLHFTLDGKRMKGEWLLVRMKPRPKERNENWLLRKVEDDYADPGIDLVDEALTSVTTGRTMVEIAKGVKGAPKARTGKRTAKLPAFHAPQLATLVDHVPSGPDWIHEVKYDGYRCLIAVGGGEVRAFTRTGLDWSDKFAPIVAAVASLDLPSALIDGEVVALDDDGKPSFRALQNGLKEGGANLAYFAFDLIAENGEDLAALPNIDRKTRLAALLNGAKAPIHFADHVENGEKLFETLCGAGYEGIVSKRKSSGYQGRRTKNWLKVKCTCRQEFVIIGWTASDKARGFRSLLLGTYRDDKLHYAGKVGTGFSERLIDELLDRMRPIERKEAPAEVPRVAARGAHWVAPKLVAEIAYAEVTAPLGEGGVLRHPSFIALREDKPAAEVVPETVDPLAVAVSNADRVIFPEARITKGQLAEYYAAMAEPILRVAGNRPISLVRCPQGRAKHCFFQKHDAGTFGEHVHHVPIKEKDGDKADYLFVDDGEGLIACVQMGAIEFHGWGSRADDVEHPDRMVFDLDPDPTVDFAGVKKAARTVKDELAALGLTSYAMLSGGKGIHVIVQLDRGAAWPEVSDFARRFAQAMGEARPEMFTANMKKVQRTGRIFLDWLRNQRGATAVMPWTVRARENAPVAVPVGWEELDDIDRAGAFTIKDQAALIERAGSAAMRRWCSKAHALPRL